MTFYKDWRKKNILKEKLNEIPENVLGKLLKRGRIFREITEIFANTYRKQSTFG